MKMDRVRQQNLYLDPSRLAGIFSAGETHVAVRKPQQQKKYIMMTKSLRNQTVGNNKTAQFRPSNGFHQHRDFCGTE